MGRIVQSRAALGTEGTILFVHIPKTGGSTLDAVLDANYPTASIYGIESPISHALDRFCSLMPDHKQRLRVIRGHGVFGLHAELEQPSLYLTMLRDPVDRVVSQYYFIRASRTHPRHAEVQEHGATLEAYLRHGLNPQADNGQVRALCGMSYRVEAEVPFGACSPAMLTTACANLDQIALVGVTECFDGFLVLAGRRLGWKRLRYTRRKVGSLRPPPVLSPEARERLIACTQLDRQLYRRARERYEAAVQTHGAAFCLQAAWLRLQNRLLSR